MNEYQNDSYEIHTIATYGLNAIKITKIYKEKADLVDWFCNFGEQTFNINFGELLSKNLPECGERYNCENRYENVNKQLDYIKSVLQKLIQKKPTTKSNLQRNIDLVCKFFELSKSQSDLLGLFARIELSRGVERLVGELDDDHRTNFKLLGGLTDQTANSVRETIRVLSSYNLTSSDNCHRTSGFLDKVLTDHFNSEKDFKNMIIGKPVKGELRVTDFSHIKELDEVLNILKNALIQKKTGVNIMFYGAPGTGKTELCKAIAKKLKAKMYFIGEVNEDDDDFDCDRDSRYSQILMADKMLQKQGNTIFVLDEAEDIFSKDGCKERGKVITNRLLENNTHPIIWTSNDSCSMDMAYKRRFVYAVKFDTPKESDLAKIWQRKLKENKLPHDIETAKRLSKEYKVPPAFIENAAKTASLINGGMKTVENTLKSMQEFVFDRDNDEEENKKPENEVPMKKDFNADLLNTDLDLKQLANRIKESKLKRFSLCLYGAPGTGKSAYAIWLAKQLGMPYIHKKCSDLIDCFVGNSEKNIAKAFEEAKNKKAILIFDEADSFLQDRKYAKNSWEVTQVNEMLTQMEKANFPFICTTNLKDSLDSASLRRFTFKVKYDFMTEEQKTKAFEYFFGFTNVDLSELKALSPADFDLTYGKAEILGYLKNKDELIKMLKAEEKEDFGTHFKIGF